MHTLITPEHWAKSVGFLAMEITLLHADQNLMPPKSAEKGFYFFSDSGIPLPRPITAIAWASLLTLDPIWGFAFPEIPWSIQHERFLLPLLPPSLKDDPLENSLSRQSGLHIKNDKGNIDWGLAMVYDGTLYGLNRSDINIMYLGAKHCRINDKPYAYPVPPLWADFNEGFQFGYIQPHHSMTMREPFEQLAAHGIPLVNRLSKREWPIEPVKRLMFRFLSAGAGKVFADAYLSAMRGLVDESYSIDLEKFRIQLHDLYKEKSPKKTKRELAAQAMLDNGFGEFMLP